MAARTTSKGVLPLLKTDDSGFERVREVWTGGKLLGAREPVEHP